MVPRLVLRFVADHTVQRLTQSRTTAVLRQHPRALLPRRVVTDVLIVTALELGYPVTFIILMEAGHAAFHVPFIIARLSRTICPA